MKSSKWSYLIPLLILVFGFPLFIKWNAEKFFKSMSEREETALIIGTSDCGPLSLQIICRFYGIPATVDELAALAQTDISGTTVVNLCYAAKQKGFEPAMVKWSIKRLKSSTSPVIVFVDGNHFMVVEPFEGGFFKIWDVPEPPTYIAEHALRSRWKGHVITFRPQFDETGDATGPAIVADRALYDFGRIWEEQKVHHTFVLRNAGNSDLEFSNIESNCRCTSLIVSDYTLAPNEIGHIKVEYDSRGYRGIARESVTISSNDPLRPVTELHLYGRVSPIPKAMPRTLSIRDDIKQTKRIIIQSSSDTRVKILSVTSEVAGVVPTVAQVAHQATVNLDIDPNALNGIAETKILIHTDSTQAPTIEVPIVVERREIITFAPKRLLFGSVKAGESCTREIRLFVPEPSQFSPLQIEKQSPALSTELVRAEDSENESWLLRATLDDTMVRGTFKDTATIQGRYRGSPFEISIPVLAMIY